MESVGSAIAVHLLSAFIHDILKLAKGEETSPLVEAIQSTERYFEGIEGLGKTLRQWLLDPEVAGILDKYVEGETGRSELQIPELGSALVHKTQFFVGEHSRATAEKIVSVFLGKVRAAYLTASSVGSLHIANRQERRFDALEQQVQHQLLTAVVESAGGLKTSLQMHFDEATAKLEAEDFPAAKALFESLLVEIERTPARNSSLERSVHASLGKVAGALGENDRAVKHYRVAARLDDDRVRAAVNLAVADLIEQKPQEALLRFDGVGDAKSSPAVYEYSAVRVGALLRLKRYDEAIETARSIHVVGKEARWLELIGLAYRQSGQFEEAEQAYRDALAQDTSRPELQYSLVRME